MELEGRGDRPVLVHERERELGAAVVVRAERVAIGDVCGSNGLGRDRAARLRPLGALEAMVDERVPTDRGDTRRRQLNLQVAAVAGLAREGLNRRAVRRKFVAHAAGQPDLAPKADELGGNGPRWRRAARRLALGCRARGVGNACRERALAFGLNARGVSALVVRDALDEGQRHGLTAFARLVQAIFDASVGVLVGACSCALQDAQARQLARRRLLARSPSKRSP